jgi:TonB family protein
MTRSLPVLLIPIAVAGAQRQDAVDATALIKSVAEKARNAKRWEGEALLRSRPEGGEIPLRFSIEGPSSAGPARARLEILGGSNPLVRLCDGTNRSTYSVRSNQFWTAEYSSIDSCAYPFTEWSRLDSLITAPKVAGPGSLKLPDRTVKCTVVGGDVAAQDSMPAGRRTLCVDSAGFVWIYRIQNTAGDVWNFSFSWQARAFLARSADVWKFEPPETAARTAPPSVEPDLPDVAEPATSSPELPKNIYRIGGKVQAPTLIRQVEPKYTKAARKALIQGTVLFSVVIGLDGTPSDLEITRSLDPGLDREAMEAVAKWRFHPAVRDGKAVASLATIEVNFKLVK